jgi:hypothetical protein
MTSLTPTISRRLRRLLPAALIAATAVLGASAFGDPGIAGAAPKEWDIGAYDDCVRAADLLFVEGKINSATHLELTNGCCVTSGGVLGPPPANVCSAPAANAPGRTIPPGRPIQTLTPDLPFAPPGDITQTFTPAP